MKLLPSAPSNLTNVNNEFTALKYFLGTPFTYIDNESFVDIYHNNCDIYDPLHYHEYRPFYSFYYICIIFFYNMYYMYI